MKRSFHVWCVAVPAALMVVSGPALGRAPETSITDDLLQAEARLKAPVMIAEREVDADALSNGATEFFPLGLALAVLHGLADDTLDQAPDIARLWAETARTDQQLGSGAVAPASTSLSERPGLPRLLALAVEHGAVETQQDGTAMVFTTSAYSAVAVLDGDTAANYREYDYLTRLGLFATASLTSTGTGGVDELSYENFSQIGAKVRLWGDRSVRSSRFVEAWHARMGDTIDRVLEVESDLISELMSEFEASDLREVRKRLADNLDAAAASGDEEELKREFVAQLLIEGEQLRAAHATPDRLREIANGKLAKLVAVYRDLIESRADGADSIYEEMLREAAPSVMSLKYAFNRVKESSDFSEASFLLQHDFSRGNLILNLGASFNHDPDLAPELGVVRDYNGSITLEATFRNVIIPKSNGADQSPIALSASGRVSRNEQIDDVIGSAQAKLDVPFGTSIHLPIAVTWVSRTIERDEQEFRFNIGVEVNTDQLFDLGKITQLASQLAD